MVKEPDILKKQRKSATMRDVAKLAGVSQPTVSRVLNQTNTTISISDETRSKVMAAVEEANYSPNVLARGLRTQQTQMIAVLIADISNSFYHPIVRGIQDVASEYGYDVMIANSDHVHSNEIHFCEAVSRRPVDGVIMVPIHLTTQDLGDFISRTNTPLAVLGLHIDHPQIDVVFMQDEKAVYDATRWLVEERQHRSIGFIGVPDDLPPGPRRFRGFMRALNDVGLGIQQKHIVTGDFSLESGRQAAYELIEAGDLPSVVVVLNDLMAIGAILGFQERGYQVPDDIAVIGFDDIPEAQIVRPTLTTIAQDSTDIGRKLATCLFQRIEDPTLPQCWLESPARIIKRGSA
ncbi:MAG: LacI family DNA-binding transcriptional regulator [Anaerolineae bacterium]|nr:LacI family DNA-binding transcriptional regulator [Anaerolineae bacterium]